MNLLIYWNLEIIGTINFNIITLIKVRNSIDLLLIISGYISEMQQWTAFCSTFFKYLTYLGPLGITSETKLVSQVTVNC